jgi:hypothetical protein
MEFSLVSGTLTLWFKKWTPLNINHNERVVFWVDNIAFTATWSLADPQTG